MDRLEIAARIMVHWAAARVGPSGAWHTLAEYSADAARIALICSDELIRVERETRPKCSHTNQERIERGLNVRTVCTNCGESP
jgi:hypothetical protein